MKTSDAGRKVLEDREGCKLTAYKDSVGVWTIGYGHTSAAGPPTVTPGLTITSKEASEIFARDLKQYEAGVDKALKVKALQNQYDAWVSFAYNVGVSGMTGSTAMKVFNTGDVDGGARALMNWLKPPELTSRRRGETIQMRNNKTHARITSESEFNRYLAEPVYAGPTQPEPSPVVNTVTVTIASDQPINLIVNGQSVAVS